MCKGRRVNISEVKEGESVDALGTASSEERHPAVDANP